MAGGDFARARVLGHLWASLDPHVADRGNWEDNTTHTLRLLMIAMLIFGAIVAAWAIGASVMRMIWLIGPQSGAAWPDKDLTKNLMDWKTWAFTLFQIVRGVGDTLALCAVGGLAGAALGFLFGLPNPPSGAQAAPAGQGAQGAQTDGALPRGQSWRLSSNLIKISDWLTTAIVGVSLFEAQRAFGFFGDNAQIAAGWLFAGRHGSNAVLPGAIAGSAILGFIFVNLYTQLIVSRFLPRRTTTSPRFCPTSGRARRWCGSRARAKDWCRASRAARPRRSRKISPPRRKSRPRWNTSTSRSTISRRVPTYPMKKRSAGRAPRLCSTIITKR